MRKSFDITLKNYGQETGPLVSNVDDVLFGGHYKRGSAETEENFCMKYVNKYSSTHGLQFLQEGTISSFLF